MTERECVFASIWNMLSHPPVIIFEKYFGLSEQNSVTV